MPVLPGSKMFQPKTYHQGGITGRLQNMSGTGSQHQGGYQQHQGGYQQHQHQYQQQYQGDDQNFHSSTQDNSFGYQAFY
jgi:hypothetical protein